MYLLRKEHDGVVVLRSKTFNIDNGSGTTDDDIMAVPAGGPYKILSARAIYVEATDTAGAASANVKIGSAVGGAQHVAASALEVSKAVGSYTDLTIALDELIEDQMIAVRHTGIAATEAGQYYVQLTLALRE